VNLRLINCSDISMADAATVLRACSNACPVRLNAAALRFGLVNLQKAKSLEAICLERSVMKSIGASTDKNFTDEIKKHEKDGKITVSQLCSQLSFCGETQDWCRPMCSFDEDGNICNTLAVPPLMNAIQYLPREMVITDQKELLKVFNHVSFVQVLFVDFLVDMKAQTDSKPKKNQQQLHQLIPTWVSSNSMHPYFVGMRTCGAKCNRTDNQLKN